jgi:hypothetical protein
MSSFKFTGLAAGSAAGHSLRYQQLFSTSAIALLGPIDFFTGANIASAATVNLTTATGNAVHITGTITITAVTLGTGLWRLVIFDGALTLTHHSTNNNLPGAANITTVANDRALYWSDGTTVYCVAYEPATVTGTGSTVKHTSPTFVTPILGTPTSGTLNNCDAPSTTVRGVIELLTQAEYDAGTDTTRAPTANLKRIVLAATQATTSGTTWDFTGIPAGTQDIIIPFDGFSTNGTSNILVQIGDAGGIETTGYDSAANSTGNAIDATSTAGFIMTQTLNAADAVKGFIHLRLIDPATNNWAASGSVRQGAGSGASAYFAGTKALSAELTQVRVTTVTPDTGDAGLVGLSYTR